VETSKASKAANTAAGADTENAGFRKECKIYGSWNICICFKTMVDSFISNKLKRISKISKQRRGENHRRKKELVCSNKVKFSAVFSIY